MPFADVLHHGIVTQCTKASITIAHFQDNGVRSSEMFGEFTSGQVFFVDYWGEGKGVMPAASAQVTIDRVSHKLERPHQQNRYDISMFNCEHWATSMKSEKENDDGFSRQLYEFREGRYMWERAGIFAFAKNDTKGAAPFR